MKIRIDNIDTNYIIKGEGSCVLILHGWGCNIEIFKTMIDDLSHKHKVIALDMPGFGESEEPETPWNVDDYVAFVLHFMKELGITATSLIGHSFGGRVIIKMVTKSEATIKFHKIILIDAAGIKPKQSLKAKVKVKFFKTAKKIFSIKILSELYPNVIENMRKKNGSSDYNAASPIMRAVLVRTVNEDLTHLLNQVKYPTLLIWGENDTATPLKDGKLMEELIPDSGLVVLKGASHFSFLEQSAYVLKIINYFFDTDK